MTRSRNPLAAARMTMLASAAFVLAACPYARAANAGPGNAGPGDGPTLIRTEQGLVQGVVKSPLREFLGIPYAAPPVGDLRWRPPVAPAPWTTPIDATRFANHCPQNPTPFGQPSVTEDCLYLNVFAPNRLAASAAPLPVMVWIHGGALVTGESNDYDPVKLVRQGGVIVVTLNYRLGALGYFAQSSLDAEGHVAANYGLLDQQFALAWVQRNIAAFGGDPQRVTVFGESAGGLSTFSNLASPTAAGLFSGAIVESGAYALKLPSLAQAEAAGAAFAAKAGCPDQSAACLRGLSVAQILANEGNNYLTIVDGATLPLSLDAAFATGQFNRVPVIDGSNHDEDRLFVALDFDLMGGPVTALSYPVIVAATFGAAAPLVLAQYPLSNYPSPDLALATLETDAGFACPARVADQLISSYVPTYAYEFNDPNAPELFLPPVSFPYAAAHASEIQFLFSFFRAPPPLSHDEVILSNRMVRYWTSFARAGDPNSALNPFWPPYTAQSDAMLSLVPPTPRITTGFAVDHNCAFWTQLLGGSATGAAARARA